MMLRPSDTTLQAWIIIAFLCTGLDADNVAAFRLSGGTLQIYLMTYQIVMGCTWHGLLSLPGWLTTLLHPG